MKKIDRRIHYRIVLDCETAPLDRGIEEVTPYNMLAYDIGWAIVDKHGKVYKTQSFINADVFLAEKVAMASAYYAEKIPEYWNDIRNGTRTLTNLYNIRKAFFNDVAEYNITEVYAHNMRFDYGALNNTIRWITKSAYRYFFPYNIVICDTLKMARDVIAIMPTYKNYCIENNFLTANGRPKMTAEILYRFISGNKDFTEEHKGLDDVMIEKDILAYCYSKHKKMRRTLW